MRAQYPEGIKPTKNRAAPVARCACFPKNCSSGGGAGSQWEAGRAREEEILNKVLVQV